MGAQETKDCEVYPEWGLGFNCSFWGEGKDWKWRKQSDILGPIQKGFHVGPLILLKNRKPWRGHIGQRALIPPLFATTTFEVVREDTSNWHLAGFLLLAIFLNALCIEYVSASSTFGLIAGLVAGGLIWVQVVALQLISWRRVSQPLNPNQLLEFHSILKHNPELMKASMTWLPTGGVLRQLDLHLLLHCRKLLQPLEDNGVLIKQAEFLDVLSKEISANTKTSPVIRMEEARIKSAARTPPWDPNALPTKLLRLLSGNQRFSKAQHANFWGDWCRDAFILLLVFIAGSWLVGSWAGNSINLGEALRALGFMGSIFVMMVLCLPRCLARMVAVKCLPLTANSLPHTWNLGSKLITPAAHLYLSLILPNEAWSAQDIKTAIELGEPVPIVKTKRAAKTAPLTDSSKDFDMLGLPHKKPWRGHLGQRMLVPFVITRDLAHDARERPLLSSMMIVLPVLLLECLVGVLHPYLFVGAVPTVLILKATCLQIELLKMLCYIHVSMELEAKKVFDLGKIKKAYPCAARRIKEWNNHPMGLRIWDVKVVLKRLEAREGAKAAAFNRMDEPNQAIPDSFFTQAPKARQTLIAKILSLPGATPVNPSAEKSAMKRKTQFNFFRCFRYIPNSTRDFQDLVLSLSFERPLGIAAFSALIFSVLYLAICGLVWMGLSFAGYPSSGWDVLLPLGKTVSLILLGGGFILLGVMNALFYRSVAPTHVIEAFFADMQYHEDARYSVPYLAAIPFDEPWTVQDLARAHRLVINQKNNHARVRECSQNEARVRYILDTHEATTALTHVHAERLEDTTPQVVAAGAPRRL